VIRARLRRDDGFALILTVIVLLVGLLLSTALIMQAVATHDAVTRDGASKRAIQAARAGADSAAWLMTAMARTTDSGNANTVCAQNAGGTVSYSAATAGWCAPVTRQLSADESVTYRVSAPFTSGPGQTSRDIVSYGTVPAANGASVTRRVRQRITGGSPDLFTDYAVASLDDLTLSNNAQVGTQQISGNARSNGNIILANNADIYGDATPGPGKAVTSSGASTVHGSTTPADTPLVLDPVIPPPLPADNGQIDAYWAANCGGGKCSSTWSNRVLDMKSNDNITITVNTYVLCQLTMENNATLTFQPAIPTQPVRIYIDSPANCGGQTSSITMASNNTTLSAGNSPYPLQFYVVGADTPTSISLSNHVTASWIVYAPRSNVSLVNNITVVGGIAANKISFSNSAEIDTPPNGSGGLQIGGPPTYTRGSFVECTSQQSGSSPSGGC
jgi:Tfp pilus assembly protein PilX